MCLIIWKAFALCSIVLGAVPWFELGRNLESIHVSSEPPSFSFQPFYLCAVIPLNHQLLLFNNLPDSLCPSIHLYLFALTHPSSLFVHLPSSSPCLTSPFLILSLHLLSAVDTVSALDEISPFGADSWENL